MSFADDLRKIQPRDPRNEKLKHLVALNVATAQDQCGIAASHGQRQISGFASADAWGRYWKEDEELSMHYGTAEQRSAARAKSARKSNQHKGERSGKLLLRYGLEIFDKNEADLAANMVSFELKKLGFTRFQVRVVEFHNVICVSKVNHLLGTVHDTYQEAPGIYYYLHISISW